MSTLHYTNVEFIVDPKDLFYSWLIYSYLHTRWSSDCQGCVQIGSLTSLQHDHIACIDDTAFWSMSMCWTVNLSLLKFYFNILWSLDTFFNVDDEINFKAIKNLKMHWPWDDNNYLLQIFSLFTNTFRRKTSAKITRSWYAQTCMVEKITVTAPESLNREVDF